MAIDNTELLRLLKDLPASIARASTQVAIDSFRTVFRKWRVSSGSNRPSRPVKMPASRPKPQKASFFRSLQPSANANYGAALKATGDLARAYGPKTGKWFAGYERKARGFIKANRNLRALPKGAGAVKTYKAVRPALKNFGGVTGWAVAKVDRAIAMGEAVDRLLKALYPKQAQAAQPAKKTTVKTPAKTTRVSPRKSTTVKPSARPTKVKASQPTRLRGANGRFTKAVTKVAPPANRRTTYRNKKGQYIKGPPPLPRRTQVRPPSLPPTFKAGNKKTSMTSTPGRKTALSPSRKTYLPKDQIWRNRKTGGRGLANQAVRQKMSGPPALPSSGKMNDDGKEIIEKLEELIAVTKETKQGSPVKSQTQPGQPKPLPSQQAPAQEAKKSADMPAEDLMKYAQALGNVLAKA